MTPGAKPPYVRIMKELLRTTNPATLAFANALLAGEGITAFELDVHMSLLDGGIGAFPRRLMVAERDFFMAKAILRDNGVGDG